MIITNGNTFQHVFVIVILFQFSCYNKIQIIMPYYQLYAKQMVLNIQIQMCLIYVYRVSVPCVYRIDVASCV